MFTARSARFSIANGHGSVDCQLSRMSECPCSGVHAKGMLRSKPANLNRVIPAEEERNRGLVVTSAGSASEHLLMVAKESLRKLFPSTGL